MASTHDRPGWLIKTREKLLTHTVQTNAAIFGQCVCSTSVVRIPFPEEEAPHPVTKEGVQNLRPRGSQEGRIEREGRSPGREPFSVKSD